MKFSNIHLTDKADATVRPWFTDSEIVSLPKAKEDVNADGVVDIQDLLQIASNFGEGWRNTADVNGDQIVNIVDLTSVTRAMRNQENAK